MYVKLLSITQDAEKLIEQAGRICYNSDMNAETRGQFIRKRIDQGHESILEHASATFQVEGVSRALTHQLVRHRLANYSQESQRYVKVLPFDFVIPQSIYNNEKALKIYLDVMDKIDNSYQDLINLDIKAEDARYILPNATKTKLIMSANFREWRHIIKIRTEKHAQWEIRELMSEIKAILQESSPNCFEGL